MLPSVLPLVKLPPFFVLLISVLLLVLIYCISYIDCCIFGYLQVCILAPILISTLLLVIALAAILIIAVFFIHFCEQ